MDSDAVNVVFTLFSAERLTSIAVRLYKTLSLCILSSNSFLFSNHIIIFDKLWAQILITARAIANFAAPGELLPNFKLNKCQ